VLLVGSVTISILPSMIVAYITLLIYLPVICMHTAILAVHTSCRHLHPLLCDLQTLGRELVKTDSVLHDVHVVGGVLWEVVNDTLHKMEGEQQQQEEGEVYDDC
jgi:hypothetical protein